MKEVATMFRDLAKAFEEEGYAENMEYSCVAVERAARRRRLPAAQLRLAYETTFGFEDPSVPSSNERKLWGMRSDRQKDMRVLMLGFMAAMAETGDL